MTWWAWPAVAGLAVSAAVHLVAYVAPPWSPGDWVLWLAPNIFVLVLVMIIRSRGLFPRSPARTAAQRRAILDPLAAIPPVVWVLGVALFLYTFVNFFVSLGLLRAGRPAATADGRRYLDYKGRHVRDLSAQEYDALAAAEIRLATGHLMLFHGVLAVYFVWVDPRRRRPRES